ncbi:hypothetical protein G9G53_22660 [Paenibacillus sp. EKM206P]|uniref:hypothetical protein n=1 Tax=Paenibacillus sp. EKM206P TaxID=1683674 RepID=UPI0013ED295E|nr:hypothetical protein [Paenibacillus sp. EKM206P]KAF6569093.1 hypothetical protein G9G53_22660 [Paenibacillus sp. EKM206P]
MTIIPYYETHETPDAENPGTIKITYSSPVGLPTPEEVRKRWCYGLTLADQYGQTIDDRDILGFLMASVKETERQMGVFLKPTVIRCNAEARGLEVGIDYEIEEPPYDYDAQRWQNFGFLQLRQRYANELEAFKLVTYGGQINIDFMQYPDWIKLYKKSSQLHVVTKGGGVPMLGGYPTGYSAAPFVVGMLSRTPQVFHVDYTAGLTKEQITEDIRAVVGKQAAVAVLGVASDAVMAGVSGYSLTLDGVAESFTSTASTIYGKYAAHITQLQQEVNDFFSPKGGGARTKMRGFTMGGI